MFTIICEYVSGDDDHIYTEEETANGLEYLRALDNDIISRLGRASEQTSFDKKS